MITNLLAELRNERSEGDTQAEELVQRIDAHIRDLEVLKLWIKDSAGVRSARLGGLIDGNLLTPVADEPKAEDAATPEATDA